MKIEASTAKSSEAAAKKVDEKCICQICTCGRHRCKHRPSVAPSTSAAMTIEASARSEMASKSEERKTTSMQYSSSSQMSEKKAAMSSSRRSMSTDRVVEAKSLSANLLALTGSQQAKTEASTVLASNTSQAKSEAVTSSSSIVKVSH